ncbi:unnamed protein product [Bursaphelenchus xylophilus]|uniref:(pine wood nematode) hypothetical protein n=1 Tax=Bursaphelenchus xylophilus TaxID=6326 RepID=A0A1I7SMF1_BURXY|nr:unnamed protein product [Bursaphelenchus xylophilus]CAG9130164.1 unnamed protein product [Bursaphelenchus xylophilus]
MMILRCPVTFLIVPKRFVHDSSKGTYIKIGSAKVPVRKAKSPEFVPKGYFDADKAEWKLEGLKWLLRKDTLNQDVFLIGVPGSLRSDLILNYLELCNREFEYLSLTRDTTEADIKQRREIRGGTATYTDLCAVRAALNGRVLVIDGVEKAERNVLPILNNLLENREMQLDDGRFLMAPTKFDKLLEKYSEKELNEMKLERVSEDFHVIALGLPVPRFKGHSLDPPLRSRFQCLNLADLPFNIVQKVCAVLSPKVDPVKRSNLIALCFGLNVQQTAASLSMPRVPIDNMIKAIGVWNLNPHLSENEVLDLFYPKETILKRETELPILNQFIHEFSIKRSTKKSFSSIRVDDNTVTLKSPTTEDITFTVPTGVAKEDVKRFRFVATPSHEDLLADLSILHSQTDFCVLGAKGSGKTALIEEFGRRLNYHLETITLFQDMNSRELIQQRRMLPNGDTVWEDSQLIKAAKEGHLCVLDGLEKVHWSTAEVLSSLVHHRFIDLPDGGRLVSPEAFEILKKENEWNDNQLNEKGVYKISPSFRLVALGDSESADASGNTCKWLNDQVLCLFLYKTLHRMTLKEQKDLIFMLIPNVDTVIAEKLLQLADYLKSTSDSNLRHVGLSLSLRRMISIMKRVTQNPDEGIYESLNRSVLSKFLPKITKQAFQKALVKFDIKENGKSNIDDRSWKEDLKLSTQSSSKYDTRIPDVVFYDNIQHLQIMQDMAVDFSLGEHILLIGNQGVGKNKITDRFLQHIERPRQYMQLHRDTTVQSLTVQSTVSDGKLKFEDSPLVKAVKEGLVLVVDEADKAPLHVIAVLKSLLDSGYLYLADGRRIQPQGASLLPDGKSVPIHPDFRMIMLANRPGFPFLGNDLFNVLGDLFAVHIVDNPDRLSEISMLKKYGPSVPPETVELLVSIFDELRRLSDEGLLSYPYSTRELVNIVKHIDKFPDDPLTEVVRNVFDFDAYSKDAVSTIENVFRSYGVPLGLVDRELPVQLAKRHSLPSKETLGNWGVKDNVVPIKVKITNSKLAGNDRTEWNEVQTEVSTRFSRAYGFTEQSLGWQLDLPEGAMVSSILNQGQRMVVAVVNSPTIFVIPNLKQSVAWKVSISSLLPRLFGNYRPRIRMAAFGEDEILIHEEMSNTLLKFNFMHRFMERVETDDQNRFMKLLGNKISSGTKHWRLVEVDNTVSLLFHRGNNGLIKLDAKINATTSFALPQDLAVDHIIPIDENSFLVLENEKTFLLTIEGKRCFLRDLDVDPKIPLKFESGSVLDSKQGVKSEDGVEFNTPNFLLTNEDFYYIKSSMFPQTYNSGQVFAVKREDEGSVQKQPPYYYNPETALLIHPSNNSIVFSNGLIVRALPLWRTPAQSWPDDAQTGQICGFLEVVDIHNDCRYHFPMPSPEQPTYYNSWAQSLSAVPFVMSKGSDGNSLYTCDLGGGIRQWEVDQTSLLESYRNWRRSLGLDRSDERLEITRGDDDFDLSKLDEPKFGKVDPKNTPHAGGNTWAGGTGGYNTAGLGGVGGPFRLDAGHDIKQMSDVAKSQVPEEIKQKARQIAKKEYQKRLKDIEMSEHDAEEYQKIHSKISKQVNSLRNVIESLEAREKERQWSKNQTAGDLDDGKLIEGIAGEKNIYRRRVEQIREPGTVQTKPKRLQLLVDVSGSMYRFNGHDQRLRRSLEATLLVMEALKDHKDKVKYDIVGHSGDSPEVVFTQPDKPPENEKSRMDVLKKMLAHSQFCFSGDYTLEAIEIAAKKLSKEMEVDERFVIALSDANLDRYGIKPEHLARALEMEENVHCFLILIGSLGPQAERLKNNLPQGKAFIIQNTAELPQIMKDIFSSTLV